MSAEAQRFRIFAKLKQGMRRPFDRWAARRRPKGRSIELNQKRIFIFPSRSGWGFIAVAILLLLIGVNYENNLLHAVAFLLLSIFVVSIIHTYGNLSGIKVTAIKGYPCFAGEQAEFELRLSASGKRERENVQLAWKGCQSQTVDMIDHSGCTLRLYHPAPERGLLLPRPLLIKSGYPLGLLNVWSWLEVESSAVVYPAPQKSLIPSSLIRSDGEGRLQSHDGGEDFAGLEQYHPGMPLRHVAWKAYARGQGMHAKTFHAEVDERVWLDWEELAGMPTEIRLSCLCYLVLQLEKQGEHYGLKLPGKRFEPDRGKNHRQGLLTALALFPGGGNE